MRWRRASSPGGVHGDRENVGRGCAPVLAARAYPGPMKLRASDWLDKASIRALAVKASCDPRTIVAVIEGRPVRGLAGHRAVAALLDAGLLPPRQDGGAGEPEAGNGGAP